MVRRGGVEERLFSLPCACLCPRPALCGCGLFACRRGRLSWREVALALPLEIAKLREELGFPAKQREETCAVPPRRLSGAESPAPHYSEAKPG